MYRVCHVVFDRFPQDSRVRRYANSILEGGAEVFVVCIGNHSDGTIESANNRLKIFRLPLAKMRSSFARRIFEYLLFEIYAFVAVTYIFFRYKVKTFHVHTLPDFLVFSCIVPRLFLGRIILDFHELFPEFMIQHKPGLNYESLLIRTLLLQEKLSFRFATDIIVFHDPAKRILSGRIRSSRDITVVMNGVDPAEMPEMVRCQQKRFRIVYNGTINFNLNLGLVIDALSFLKENSREVYDSVEFELYGDGPDLDNILLKAREQNIGNVFYRGRLRFTEMMERLSNASVCVLPPLKDIYSDLYYSLKLTEMIYLKIPVIATRLDTYLYYYPEDCIYYFESGDACGLAEAIRLVYEDPEEVKRHTNAAWERYQGFSWPIMKGRYLGLARKEG
jgi:glycosyltransferase involved in cell wall biosynthesis